MSGPFSVIDHESIQRQSVRLDAVRLAVQCHELGMAQNDDTVIATAQKIVDFISD